MRLRAAILASAVLSGCGGGAGGSAPPVMPTPARAGTVTFAITIPSVAPGFAAKRPQYVSVATQSLGIAIAGPTPITTSVNLTPGSDGCTTSGSATVCTVTLPGLDGGSYLASMTAYDGLAATGHPLSAAQAVPFTVIIGGVNPVALVLSGIPASTRIVATSTHAVSNGTGGFHLVGQGAQSFVAQSLDAGGDVIVGPGTPTFAIATTGSLAALASPASSSGAFTVTPPAVLSGATASVSATPSFAGQPTDGCAQPGAVCAAASATLDMQALSLLFVSNQNTNAIKEYELPSGTLVATIQDPVAGPGPVGFAFDPSGELVVGNWNAGTVVKYAPPYTGASTTLALNESFIPNALAFDAGGNLYVADLQGNRVLVYRPPYTGAAATVISNGVSAPRGLAFDASGDLFVVNSGSVTEYVSPYAGAPTATITNGLSGANAAAMDGSANLYVANSTNSTVTAYAPPYTGSPTTVGSGFDQAFALAFDPSGTLYLGNYAGAVGSFAPPYTGPGSSVAATGSGLGSIVVYEQP